MAELVRNRQLDGLRGYAAAAVVIFHCILDRDHTFDHRIVRPTFGEIHGLYNFAVKIAFIAFNGEAAVVLFFVLSGTVLFNSLCARDESAIWAMPGFVIRRWIRLYPTFAVALACAFATCAVVGAYAMQAPHFWENLALLDFSVLGTSWTLQIEFLAIPFVLIAYGAHRRIGVVGIALTYLVFSLVVSSSILHEPLLRFARFLPCFAFGMLIPTNLGRSIFHRFPAWIAPMAAVAMVAVRSAIGLHWWSATIEELFAALLIGMLYYRRAARFGVCLETPVSQYLGRVSYSLYLFNVVFLTLADHWTRDWPMVRQHPLEMGMVLAVPVLAGGLSLAHCAEKFLERPSIRIGHQLTARAPAFV